jgi:hypothetical protein
MARPLAAISLLPLPLEAGPRFLRARAQKDDLERAIRRIGDLGLGSAVRPPNDVHELFDLLPLLGLVARSDGVLNAMGDVIAQDLLFEPPEGGANGGNLRHDIDAVAILLDHARDATHLAFDPIQPLRA